MSTLEFFKKPRKSKDPYLKHPDDLHVAKFGHINAIVKYLRSALKNVVLLGSDGMIPSDLLPPASSNSVFTISETVSSTGNYQNNTLIVAIRIY